MTGPGNNQPPDYVPATWSADPVELERTTLSMLTCMTAAWFVIGAAGAGLILAFTGSAWALLCFLPSAVFMVARVAQAIHIAALKRGEQR